MPGGYEWIIIVVVLLLLFGAKKLPDMARSVGQSARVFKGEMKGLKDDEKKVEPEKPAQDATATPPPAPQALPATTTTNGTPGAATPGETAPQAQPGRSTDVT